MIHYFFPYAYVDSVHSIDYGKLFRLGYRGIIFDIDNTLVHHGDDSTERIDELFCQIHEEGIKTCILSNNSEKRVKSFLKNIDSFYICNAGKPDPDGYYEAIKLMEIKKEEVIMIGDQIFTDILGANRCGIASILVKFIRIPEEIKYGKRRAVEKMILRLYHRIYSCGERLDNILKADCKPAPMKRKLFCELNPVCYQISLLKERLRKQLHDTVQKEQFATEKSEETLPNLVFSCSTNMIKKGSGIDPELQYNKAHNIRIAANTMNGILIRPGEVFSFWKCVGKLTRKKGYKNGRVIQGNQLVAGIGGGLCNLANMIHILILHSPLDVTEFHCHSDALAPDQGIRVPFSAGTSVSYYQIDYRFKNNTDQNIQLLVWCEDNMLNAELRSEYGFLWYYEIIEENHHFSREENRYYRVSQIYKKTLDKATGECIDKKLVLDNHSEVMFDYSLIPKEQIWE